MFYFLISPYLTYNFILIAAAIIPAVFLLVRVYRADVLEKEDPVLLRRLVLVGILSTQLALLCERVFSKLLVNFIDPSTELYRILLYFVVVGVSEEGSKYFFLRRNTWNSSQFNCLFDGVVYATFVSLGFALWENISYVMHYGLVNAFARAFTAIPGHACFGVFMGVFYSAAKLYERAGDLQASRRYRFLAVLVPVVIHGLYDYIATINGYEISIYFVVFVVILFFVTLRIIKSVSANDRYIV